MDRSRYDNHIRLRPRGDGLINGSKSLTIIEAGRGLNYLTILCRYQ